MILAALLAAATSPIETEHAFAAAAQRDGQWTAFRAYAAPDAVMFVPSPVDARRWLMGRADPKRAAMWWPAASWRSCDGRVAVNTGPWVRDGGDGAGWFTTVWVRQPDGAWRWVYDGGDVLAAPRPAGDRVRETRAACGPRATAPDVGLGGQTGGGAAPDGTLRWGWRIAADGTRRFALTIAGRATPAIDETTTP